MTVMGIRPGLPSSAREEGVWEGGPLPSPGQGTEKSHHLGLQKKPLNEWLFQGEDIGANLVLYPLSQLALAGAAKPQ